MGIPQLPPPLESAAAYQQEIVRLEGEIAAVEKHLGRLRRERGCRVLQLEELQTPGG
jgi:hypothetical protein